MVAQRRVIRITAEDSPNVRLARAEQAAGLVPSGRTVVPGVLGWDEYCHRLATWDDVRKCIGLDAQFYVGPGLLLFPPDWLNLAHQRHYALQASRVKRVAKAIGCDPGEGVANTSWCVIDEWGIIEIQSYPTPNTNRIVGDTLALIRKHNVEAENVCFDRGGGGKQRADDLRTMGYPVRTVGFGETLAPDPKHGKTQVKTKKDTRELEYSFVNRRTQMYHDASSLLDPTDPDNWRDGVIVEGCYDTFQGFAVPELGIVYTDLRKQLAVMPKLPDGEGRYWMPPKSKKDENSKVKTLIEMIGRSPDEADSFVLAVHALLHKAPVSKAGVA